MINLVSNVVVGILVLLGVITGYRIGKTNKDIPSIPTQPKPSKKSIFEAYRDKKEKEEEEQRQKEFNIMMENINNYNGSSEGQQDVK